MMQKILVPDIGENVETGTVVGVLVSLGDRVEKDDAIIELETEKAVVEIPAPDGGIIKEIRVKPGDELHIGDIIAILETEPETIETVPQQSIERSEEPVAEPSATEDQTVADDQAAVQPAAIETTPVRPADSDAPVHPEKTTSPAPASPSVRRIARELGVDIHTVKGSGRGGRISAEDVKNHLKTIVAATQKSASGAVSSRSAQVELPDFSRWGPIETQDISTVRRITAENMALSTQQIPQVSQFDTADITHLNDWIASRNRKSKNTASKLTITAVIVKILARGLQRFPHFNASLDLDHDQIILKQYVHIGLAVDTERGLLVPVLQNADSKSITELADEISDLAQRARHKRLKPDEMAGGSFTVSNQGGIGGTNFTPIVFWPQAAILGISRAVVQPLYMDGNWVPRTMLPLVLSYDHRINDGADAARFLRWICDALENPIHMDL